jgi:hypothetical protein
VKTFFFLKKTPSQPEHLPSQTFKPAEAVFGQILASRESVFAGKGERGHGHPLEKLGEKHPDELEGEDEQSSRLDLAEEEQGFGVAFGRAAEVGDRLPVCVRKDLEDYLDNEDHPQYL